MCPKRFRNIIRDLLVYWKSFLIILTPIALLPLPLYLKTESARCGYAVILMAVYWMTELIPLPVTALLPVFLFGLLGVLPVDRTCAKYLQETNFLFVGGLIVAVAVEETKLHRRIALKTLILIGCQPERLILGFMVVTMFLSMWISNTAATAMMVPIAVAILQEINISRRTSNLHMMNNLTAAFENPSRSVSVEFRPEPKLSPIKSTAFLTVRLNETSDIGVQTDDHLNEMESHSQISEADTSASSGLGTQLKQLQQNSFQPADDCQKNITTATLLCICYAANIGGTATLTGTGPNLVFTGQLKGFGEISVLFWFIILVLLWIFREPKIIRGWGSFFGPNYVKDSSSAIFIGCILFAWPSAAPDFLCFKKDKSGPTQSWRSLMTWSLMQRKFPWGVIILLGGGFAVAEAVKESGLSSLIGCFLQNCFKQLPASGTISLFVIFLTFVTEISSNTATASVFIPLLFGAAENMSVNPLYFGIPAAIAPSFAFMLPVATPPNAIVYQTGLIRLRDMIFAGFVTNWLCIAVTLLTINTYTAWLFDLTSYPAWAGTQLNFSSCSQIHLLD